MKKILILIAIVSLVILIGCAKKANNAQIPNPSAKFCEDKGYKYEIVNNPDGSQAGDCILDHGLRCDGWAYYRGECPTCQQYCESQPHIQCVGTWNNSGTYPDCKCGFVCSTTETTS